MSAQKKSPFTEALDKVDAEVDLLKKHKKVLSAHYTKKEAAFEKEAKRLREQLDLEARENIREQKSSLNFFSLSLAAIGLLYVLSLPRQELAELAEFLTLRFPIAGLIVMYLSLKKFGK